jgi:DNA-binding MltR family transcriptional regulator
MAASRNRGRKKPKLRDYSHLVLTPEEKDAVDTVARSIEQPSIVTAILGCVLIEHELDILLGKKLKKRDEDTWRGLQEDSGPLRSFSTKISMGYALGVYNDKLENDLNIVRVLRNAFAHSKKLLEFDDPLVIPELLKTHLLPARLKKSLRKKTPSNQLAKASFLIICLRVQTALLQKQTRALKAQNYRIRRKNRKISPLANALLGYGYGAPTSLPYARSLLPVAPKSSLLSSLVGQISGPSLLVPQGFAHALLPFQDTPSVLDNLAGIPLVLREADESKKK